MRQSNGDVLVNALEDISNPESVNYGKYWTQEMIDDVVNPPTVEVDRLVGYLKDTGVDCVQRGAALECSTVPLLGRVGEHG